MPRNGRAGELRNPSLVLCSPIRKGPDGPGYQMGTPALLGQEQRQGQGKLALEALG